MDLNTDPPYNFEEGALLLVDKPYEWTSFDVVKKIRYTVKPKKCGHAGTLDPLATGLLLIGVGKYTKKLEHLQGLTKEYTGVIKLGVTTPSFDRETEEENQNDLLCTNDELFATAKAMTGEQEQIPPMYSALKRDGKRLYEYIRKGKTIVRPPRPITIYEFDITQIQYPFVHFRIKCSKGTYIRTIANDFGASLGVGGYLHDLRRTKVGDYDVSNAWQINDIVDHIKSNHADS